MPLTRIDSAFLDLDAIGGIDFDVNSSVPTLKVEATNHRVGIGHNSPAYKLDVVGDVNISSGSNYLVNGSQISTANVAENSSYLYYTDARAISAVTGSNLDMGSNTITTTGAGSFASLSTGASGVGVNISTSTISGPATLTIDPAAVGDNTGTVVIAGDLQVDGTTTTINSTTLTVDDKNIVLASGAANAAAADGAGITVDTANATLLYKATPDAWSFNKNVGIGTDSPTAKLEIKGTGGGTGITFRGTDSSGNTNFWIQDGGKVGVHYYPFVINQDYNDTDTPSSTYFYVHGSSPFIIKSDGKVGVGEDTPASQIDIKGNVSSTTQFSGFDGLRVHNANGSAFGVTADMYFTAGTGSSNRGAAIGSELVSGYGNDLYFATNAGNVSSTNVLTERLRITSAGAIKLNDNNIEPTGAGGNVSTAYNNAGWEKIVFDASYNTSPIGPNKIILQNDTGGAGWYAGFGIASNELSIYSGGNTVFYQGFNTAGAINERFRITSDGNVGIGTDNPSAKLQVTTADTTYLKLTSTTLGDRFVVNGAGAVGIDIPEASIGARLHIGTSAASGIIVEDSIGDTVFIADDGNGRVGVGTDIPTHKLEVKGGDIRVDKAGAVDGILGEAYSGYFGLKHSDQTLSSEYMIISANSHTYISATAGNNVYIRSGANDSANQLIVGSGNDALTWRGGKVFHAGNSSPVDTSEVNSNSTEFPFKSIKLTGSGIGDSYDKRVILIIPRVTTNSSSHNKCVGKITASKTGGNVFETFDVSVQSVWNNTEANFISMGQNIGDVHKWVTCTYGGVEWIAIEPDYGANPYNNFWFHGQHIANSLDTNGDALKVISYYDTQGGGTVLNSEINSSIADWNGSQNKLCFNSSEIATIPPISQSLARSAGWVPAYSNNVESSVIWNYTEDAVEISDPPGDAQVGAAYKAVKLKSGDKVRINLQMKGSSASSTGVYIRLYFYNGTSLPDGKTHVSNDSGNSHPLVQEHSSLDNGWHENSSISTSYVSYSRDYTASTDGYLSIVVLNWTAYTGSIYVKEPIIHFENEIFDVSTRASIGLIDGNGDQSYDKIRVWNSSSYTIGMKSGHDFGWLSNEYAMTFTMNNSANRGFLWRDVDDSASDGCMSVTTAGNLCVKNVIAVGGQTTRYLREPTGSYGSIQISGSGFGSYEGFSIDGRAVFMHDGANTTGLYNDVDNEWMFVGVRNSYTRMYFNGAVKVQTSATGATVTGLVNETSDIKLKKNIETIDSALEKVLKLRGVYFDWKDEELGTSRNIGVIAQEIEEIVPEVVTETEQEILDGKGADAATIGIESIKSVAYGSITALLIEAIKDQQKQIDDLKSEIESLKNP